MILPLLRRATWLYTTRRAGVLLIAISALVLASATRVRLFDTRDAGECQMTAAGISRPVTPARLVPLDAGTQLQGEGPPAGWSHLVIKSIPKLTTGDLDTVSEQAFEIAQRIRPLIVADVQRSSSDPHSPFHIHRVGVGLCAPGREGEGDVVVSSSSVEGTSGPWSTKQRLILAAMSLETSRARLAAATSSFALIRTSVTFLVSGTHRKIDLYYALLVDRRTGSLQTLVWPDCGSTSGTSPSPLAARRLSATVFDLPQDVHATRILGNIPVSWSFATCGLPSGIDVPIPHEVAALMTSDGADPGRSAALEEALRRGLKEQEPGTGFAALPR